MPQCTFTERRPSAGRVHSFENDATIGREGCDVVLADPDVSRRHAAIRVSAQGIAIEDLSSTNGTFVNGRRINGLQRLNPLDVVQIGDVEWQLEPNHAAASGPAAAAPPRAEGQVAATPAVALAARGDVPPPPEVTPSAVHRTLPAAASGAPPAFTPVGTRQTSGSAATRAGYTAFCLAVFVATLVALIVYFAAN